MSTIIKLRCIDQVLTFESTPVIASGGLGEDVLSVEFCSKWDGLSKTAVFWRTEEEGAYHAPLGMENTCIIPREVLAEDGAFYFGIFGVSEDGRQRTTEAVRYTVVKGAITSGTKPSDPTPDVYAQLLARYAEVLAAAESAESKVVGSAEAAAASKTAAEKSAKAAAASQAAAEAAAAHTHTAEDVGAMAKKSIAVQLATPGWYAIGYFVGSASPSQGLVMVGNSFKDDQPHAVVAAVSMNAYNPSIVVLASSASTVFTKLRIVPSPDGKGYFLEVYYAPSSKNWAYATIVEGYQSAAAWEVKNFAASLVTDPELGLIQTVEKTPAGTVLTTGDLPKLFGDHNVPTAADVGARPASWTPTAEDVGARPVSWTPTAEDVKAQPARTYIRMVDGISKKISGAGWYRIAVFSNADCLLRINHAYSSTTGTDVLFYIHTGQTNPPNLVVLSDNQDAKRTLSKIRLVNTGSGFALDIFYRVSGANTLKWSGVFFDASVDGTGSLTPVDYVRQGDADTLAEGETRLLEVVLRHIPVGSVLTDASGLLLDGSNAMTGDLIARTGGAEGRLATTATRVGIRNTPDLEKHPDTYDFFGLYGGAPLADALKFLRKSGSEETEYNVLHTGNLSANGVARIETGSYVGTGGDANSLTFGFAPKFVYVAHKDSTSWSHDFAPYGMYRFFWVYGMEREVGPSSMYGNYSRKFTLDGNTLSWMHNRAGDGWDAIALNLVGEEYFYIAIG